MLLIGDADRPTRVICNRNVDFTGTSHVLYDTVAKYNSYKRSAVNSSESFLARLCNQTNNLQTRETVPSKRAHSSQYENTHKTHTEEKLDETGAPLETPPRKSLSPLTQHIGASASSAQNAKELLNLHLYNTTVVRKLYDTYCIARLDSVE
jgi:hypothetical protein